MAWAEAAPPACPTRSHPQRPAPLLPEPRAASPALGSNCALACNERAVRSTTCLVGLTQQPVSFINHKELQVLQREPRRASHVRYEPARECTGRKLSIRADATRAAGPHRPGVATSTSTRLPAGFPCACTSAAASLLNGPLPETAATSKPTAQHSGWKTAATCVASQLFGTRPRRAAWRVPAAPGRAWATRRERAAA